MRVVLQRVERATALLDGESVGAISAGLVALTGFGRGDTEDVAGRMAAKVARLRVLEHGESKFGRSVLDAGAEVLCISQFTVYADTSRGRRPSFSHAAEPAVAEGLYAHFTDELAALGVRVRATPFASRLVVDMRHWGPFTLMLEL